MAKRTRVSPIVGLVIESAIIWHSDGEEGPSLELRFIGGKVFWFTAEAKVLRIARAHLADNHTGQLENDIKQTFKALAHTGENFGFEDEGNG